MLLRTHPPVFGRRLHDAGPHLRSSDVVPDVVGADRLADGVADTREPDSLADHLANHLEPDLPAVDVANQCPAYQLPLAVPFGIADMRADYHTKRVNSYRFPYIWPNNFSTDVVAHTWTDIIHPFTFANFNADHVTDIDPDQLEPYGRSHTSADVIKAYNLTHGGPNVVPDAVTLCNTVRIANCRPFSTCSPCFAERHTRPADLGQHGRHYDRGCSVGLPSSHVRRGPKPQKEAGRASRLDSADVVRESAV